MLNFDGPPPIEFSYPKSYSLSETSTLSVHEKDHLHSVHNIKYESLQY
jgi:hypothetical protein